MAQCAQCKVAIPANPLVPITGIFPWGSAEFCSLRCKEQFRKEYLKSEAPPKTSATGPCAHCGDEIPDGAPFFTNPGSDKEFCSLGCMTIYDAGHKESPAPEVGVKHCEGKEEFGLMPPRAMELVAMAFTYGKKKYSARNWELGLKWTVLFGAAMRHLWAFWRGEHLDKDSGLPHLAHAAASVLMLFESWLYGIGTDDRPMYYHGKEPKA